MDVAALQDMRMLKVILRRGRSARCLDTRDGHGSQRRRRDNNIRRSATFPRLLGMNIGTKNYEKPRVFKLRWRSSTW